MVVVMGIMLVILRITNTVLHSFGSQILLKQYHNGKDTTEQLLAINLAITQAVQVSVTKFLINFEEKFTRVTMRSPYNHRLRWAIFPAGKR